MRRNQVAPTPFEKEPTEKHLHHSPHLNPSPRDGNPLESGTYGTLAPYQQSMFQLLIRNRSHLSPALKIILAIQELHWPNDIDITAAPIPIEASSVPIEPLLLPTLENEKLRCLLLEPGLFWDEKILSVYYESAAYSIFEDKITERYPSCISKPQPHHYESVASLSPIAEEADIELYSSIAQQTIPTQISSSPTLKTTDSASSALYSSIRTKAPEVAREKISHSTSAPLLEKLEKKTITNFLEGDLKELATALDSVSKKPDTKLEESHSKQLRPSHSTGCMLDYD